MSTQSDRRNSRDRRNRRSLHDAEWLRRVLAADGRCRVALRVSRALNAELEPQAVVNSFVRSLPGNCADWSAVYIEDETDGGVLSAFSSIRREQAALTEPATAFMRSPTARALADAMTGRHSMLVHDVGPDWFEHFVQDDVDRAFLVALAPRSVILLPLVFPSATGVLVLASTSPTRQFRPEHLAVANELTTEFGRALERAMRFHAVDQELVLIRDTTLASVSHDLRSPLHVITLAAESMRENMVPPEAVPRHLDAIITSARYMTGLVAELLEVVRARDAPRSVNPCRPTDLIDHVVRSHTPLAQRKDVRLTVECDAGMPMLSVNEHAVLRVLWNTVDNAVRACPAGGTVTIAALDQTATILFIVTNPGPGLDAEQAQHVFDPFWTTHGHHGGTGLGLAISRRIIEAHGGTMWVESQPSGPTSFHFRLPVTQVPSQVAAA